MIFYLFFYADTNFPQSSLAGLFLELLTTQTSVSRRWQYQVHTALYVRLGRCRLSVAEWKKTWLPTTNVTRTHHSTMTLSPQGSIILAGSNPNGNVTVVGTG
ncbi:hypothetical protein B0H10DRAFT_349597 [Mycena sp. CBHHK59/15]|nr:hypothetical protein B0H10DRAFT_349597 [Mycena sp. CBHHK59/15]